MLCGAVLVASLLAALWTNIALSRGSYAEHDLQARRTLLAEQEQALQEHLQEVSSPGAVDERARQLGMVKAPERAWLVLQAPQEQAVVGDPTPASSPTPSGSPSAVPSGSAGAPTGTQLEQGAVDTDSGSDDGDGDGATASSTPTPSRSGSSSPTSSASPTGERTP
ncbi:hypothetical protein SAMN06264364_11186 [Quadrisphaera granulorum]|uniref:Cell division protein FtsL n=2 Tax=Quadrisphaera granulorum TaxID=317664 RepID=A0A316A7U5_9ACTN|nr:hypothetical protein BXY45_11186 [Quadrisphaera granulorum]SZE96727.1 hypothetical protein SAMN06264364_11186 [Quadrisphaera granulorum]